MKKIVWKERKGRHAKEEKTKYPSAKARREASRRAFLTSPKYSKLLFITILIYAQRPDETVCASLKGQYGGTGAGTQ